MDNLRFASGGTGRAVGVDEVARRAAGPLSSQNQPDGVSSSLRTLQRQGRDFDFKAVRYGTKIEHWTQYGN